MKIKLILLTLSTIYSSYLIGILVFNHQNSVILNPPNSEYYFKKGSLVKAIETEPTKAEYHMNYGLELLKSLPEDSNSVQHQLSLAREEFSRAAKLKPYDQLYMSAYSIYSSWINEQLSKMR